DRPVEPMHPIDARVNVTILKPDELLLGTDAVDVVVKATVARAGQIAAATENSIAEPAPSTAETRAGSSLFRCSEEPQHNVKGWSAQHEITADKSFGARWKRAAAKCTAIRSPRVRHVWRRW